jgi:hypothetical protein
MTNDDGERRPRGAFWAKCGRCSHIWPLLYLPMEMRAAARVMGRASCPSCGSIKGITPAKQDDGELLEPLAPTPSENTDGR